MNSEDSAIIQKVEEYIIQNAVPLRQKKLLLCLSAGKDSAALLDIMIRLRETFNFYLSVFHLNHSMRGSESDADESLAALWARKYALRFFSRKYVFSEKEKSGFEENARRVRYAFISEILSAENFDHAVTAHSLSDQAETVLMRIFRGSSVAGLRSLKPVSGNILHPLLCLSSGEIYRYLEIRNIVYSEDFSN